MHRDRKLNGPEARTGVAADQRASVDDKLANFICDALVARSTDFPQGKADLAIVNATAFANVPPNQAARPTSCRERESVLRATGWPPGFVLGLREQAWYPRMAVPIPS